MMEQNVYAALEGLQREVLRKELALTQILEVLKPWPESAGGRFDKIRRLARRAL